MPFNPSNLERVWNPDIQGLDLGIASGWSYNASHDTISDVLADNYFRTFADYTGFNSTSTTFDLNDQIWCQCSDGNMICQVIAVLPNIIVTQVIPSGFNITNHGVLIGGPNDTINAITLNNGQVLVGATGSDPVATSASSLNLGTTQHAALIGGASGTISSLTLTDNQILVGATGSDPVKKTIVAGTNVTVDNNPTEIVINSTANGGTVDVVEIDTTPFTIDATYAGKALVAITGESGSSKTWTLDTGSITAGFFCYITFKSLRGDDFPILNLLPSTGTIDGAPKFYLTPGMSITIFFDGTDFIVIQSSSTPSTITSPQFSSSRRIIGSTYGYFNATTSDTQTQSLATLLSTDQLFIPFCVGPFFYDIFEFSVVVTAAVAASSVNIGVYNTLAGLPNALIMGVNMATTSTGLKSGTHTDQFLNPGLYWLAIQASTATTLALACGQLNLFPGIPGMSISGTTITPIVYSMTNSFVAGTLPATAGATKFNSINYAPIILLG